MADYPAAHSMDSTWFAVDEDGEVAFFDAGEGGAIPVEGFPLGGEAGGHDEGGLEEGELLAAGLWARAASDERLRRLLPDSSERLTRCIESTTEWDLVHPLLRSVGIWTYGNDDPIAVPYVREGSVPTPLRLDELDDGIRQRLRNSKLPLRFADSELIAPGEHVSVAAWDPAWIDTKGRAHPIEGMEDAFDEVTSQLEGMDVEDYLPTGGEPGEIFEGDEFYEAIERVLESQSDSDESRPRTSGCLGLLFRS